MLITSPAGFQTLKGEIGEQEGHTWKAICHAVGMSHSRSAHGSVGGACEPQGGSGGRAKPIFPVREERWVSASI